MFRFHFNPHRHVKIWLSPDRDVFLNLTNQWRLIQTRHKNPHDTIYLVYDERLLSCEAVEDLEIFCHKFNIIPFKVYENIFPNLKSIYEICLYEYYLDEISNLDQGGNLASASDKLRLLSAIYNLGIYSDFDVEIDTTDIPEFVEVKSPILLPLVTYRTLSTQSDYEYLYNSGEIFAVVDESHALKKITTLQKVSCQLYKRQDKETLKKSYGTIDRERGVDLIIMLCKLANQYSAREMRHMINLICDQDESFYQIFYLKKFYTIDEDKILIKDAIDNLDKALVKQICSDLRRSIQLRIINSNCKHATEALIEMLNFSDLQLLKIYREYIRETLIEMTVIFSTGALAYMYGLLHKNIFSADEVKNIVKPMSTYFYPKLFKAFKISERRHFFHISSEEHNQYLINGQSDMSWTEKGYQLLLFKDNKLNQSALTLQRFFKSCINATEERTNLSNTI